MSGEDRLRAAARRLPTPVRRAGARLLGDRTVRRVLRPVRWGNLRRRAPFSARYGFDRGTPVDRVYLHHFFADHAADMRGRLLEVDRPEFSGRYGRAGSVEILDVDGRNDAATILADLAEPDCLPVGEFDCIVLPQTLQYVRDPATAITNLWRALAPGGTLLLTVPAAAKIDHHARDADAWRFLPNGLRILLEAGCPGANVTVGGAGNALAVAAFVLGASAEDLGRDRLAPDDPDVPLLTLARVTRPAAPA